MSGRFKNLIKSIGKAIHSGNEPLQVGEFKYMTDEDVAEINELNRKYPIRLEFKVDDHGEIIVFRGHEKRGGFEQEHDPVNVRDYIQRFKDDARRALESAADEFNGREFETIFFDIADPAKTRPRYVPKKPDPSLSEDEVRKHRARAKKKAVDFEKGLRSNNKFCEAVLLNIFEKLHWPRETLISFEVDLPGRTAWLDIDLPEVEDMPDRIATPKESLKGLRYKNRSATDVRKLYARHLHGIILRLVGKAFCTLPEVDTVYASGYSQRVDKATGREADEYLLSVKAIREDYQKLNFKNVAAICPIMALSSFEIRINMTKTGIFKPIEPFSVAAEKLS